MRLWALAQDGSRRELRIEELWPHKGHLIIKFAEIDSISTAEALAGCELQVPAGERPQLEAGWAYVSDLAGCLVLDGDREIGRVQEVRFGAGEAPLLVVREGSKEYEIPYAEAYLRSVDLEGKRIQMSLPQDLLQVNAPLTAEEKREQSATRRLKT
jgi:16S rRNA processing protein RimM